MFETGYVTNIYGVPTYFLFLYFLLPRVFTSGYLGTPGYPGTSGRSRVCSDRVSTGIFLGTWIPTLARTVSPGPLKFPGQTPGSGRSVHFPQVSRVGFGPLGLF